MAGKTEKRPSGPARTPLKPDADGIVRLSGGNPQIAKGDGQDVVQSYIAAMPGWQKPLGQKLDAIIKRVVPGAEQAVRWNTPFYGTQKGYWFVSFHCMSKYLKVAFPDGVSLDPVPPGPSKQAKVRYLDIHEDEYFDEEQFASWVLQASHLPGERF